MESIVKNELTENLVFDRIAGIIEQRRSLVAVSANAQAILMYWEIGRYIDEVVLQGVRAEYGKNILSTVSTKLSLQYGSSFSEANLYRMKRFATVFPSLDGMDDLTMLHWSHICEIMRLKSDEARRYYITACAQQHWGVRALRESIERKDFERKTIANAQLTEQSAVPRNLFKDPYLLDALGLRSDFLEDDLEQAILRRLEAFIMEFGRGFAFLERQKRIIIDGEDFRIDLLFYHRLLKRLVAVELKVGRFRPQYKGQMELYLRWLDRHERAEGENAPIGLILCTEASREQIELLEMDKAGIAVAEYWTEMPPKQEFERLISETLQEAQERQHRRQLMPPDHKELQ